MFTLRLVRNSWLALPLLAAGLGAQTAYFPAAGTWQHKAPADAGMDAGKLKNAIEWAESHGSKWDFEKDQVRVFGKVLGALPAQRAATNGIILRHGYIVAEFGDTKANDPVYSAAKSFLSTVCGLAVDRGLIRSVDDPVAKYIHD